MSISPSELGRVDIGRSDINFDPDSGLLPQGDRLPMAGLVLTALEAMTLTSCGEPATTGEVEQVGPTTAPVQPIVEVKPSSTPEPTPTPSPAPKPEEPTVAPSPTSTEVPPTPEPPPPPPPPPPTPVPAPTEAPVQPPAVPEGRPNFEAGGYFGYSDNWDNSLGWIDLSTGYGGPINWGEWKVEALYIKPTSGIIEYGTVLETGARYAVFEAEAGGKTITVKLIFEGTGANLFDLAVHEQGKPGYTKFMSNRFNPEEIIEIGRNMAIHCKQCKGGGPIPDEVRTGLVWTVGGTPK